jgi:hypothetical protein
VAPVYSCHQFLVPSCVASRNSCHQFLVPSCVAPRNSSPVASAVMCGTWELLSPVPSAVVCGTWELLTSVSSAVAWIIYSMYTIFSYPGQGPNVLFVYHRTNQLLLLISMFLLHHSGSHASIPYLQQCTLCDD